MIAAAAKGLMGKGEWAEKNGVPIYASGETEADGVLRPMWQFESSAIKAPSPLARWNCIEHFRSCWKKDGSAEWASFEQFDDFGFAWIFGAAGPYTTLVGNNTGGDSTRRLIQLRDVSSKTQKFSIIQALFDCSASKIDKCRPSGEGLPKQCPP